MQEMVDAKNEKPHSTINFLPPLTLHSLGCSPAFTWGKATFALNIWILCFITGLITEPHTFMQVGRKLEEKQIKSPQSPEKTGGEDKKTKTFCHGRVDTHGTVHVQMQWVIFNVQPAYALNDNKFGKLDGTVLHLATIRGMLMTQVVTLCAHTGNLTDIYIYIYTYNL